MSAPEDEQRDKVLFVLATDNNKQKGDIALTEVVTRLPLLSMSNVVGQVLGGDKAAMKSSDDEEEKELQDSTRGLEQGDASGDEELTEEQQTMVAAMAAPRITLKLFVDIMLPVTCLILCLVAKSQQTTVPGSPPDTPDVLSHSWKTALSLIPFVLVFQGILSLKLSSRYVAPFTLLCTIIVGLVFFRDAKGFAGKNIAESSGLIALTVVDRIWWTVLEYAFNVFTAFFFLRVLQIWGVMESMREEFEAAVSTLNRKVLLVMFSFGITLAVVAPGGSNFVIAGSILINMNLRKEAADSPERLETNLRIGAVALFGNALTSAFNLVGVCITTIAEDLTPMALDLDKSNGSSSFSTALDDTLGLQKEAAREIGRLFSLQFLPLATITPVLVMVLMKKTNEGTVWEKLRSIYQEGDMFLLLSTGFSYGVMQWAVAGWIGQELPCLLAGGLSMMYVIVFEKRKKMMKWLRNKRNGGGGGGGLALGTALKKRVYLLPFLLLISILLIFGTMPGVEHALTGTWNDTAELILNPRVWYLNEAGYKFERQFAYLFHSGVVVLVIGLVTPFIVDYHTPSAITFTQPGMESSMIYSQHNSEARFMWRKGAKKVLSLLRTTRIFHARLDLLARRLSCLRMSLMDSAYDVLPVIVSITSFASLAKLMGLFGMTTAIAKALVSAFESVPAIYIFFSPLIGMLGAALTGSTTTSNFLFARLQVNTAAAMGLIKASHNSVFEVGGLQILGSTAGEMISPMNAVVIVLMGGLAGKVKEADLIRLLLPTCGLWLIMCGVISLVFIIPDPSID